MMELKVSIDSIVSEQERQNRMIDNIKSDVTRLKSLSVQYDPEVQDIKQRDLNRMVAELKKVSLQRSVSSLFYCFRITMPV